MIWGDLGVLRGVSDAGVREARQEEGGGQYVPAAGLAALPLCAKVTAFTAGPWGVSNSALRVKLLTGPDTLDPREQTAYAWSYSDQVGQVCSAPLDQSMPPVEVGDYVLVQRRTLLVPGKGWYAGLWVIWPYVRVDCP